MTPLNQDLKQENVHVRKSAVERLQSRWSTSPRGVSILDRPPSQPLSRRQLSRSVSKWNSGVGVVSDSSPLQGLSHRGSAVRSQESGSRWSSGSQAAFDMASPEVLGRHRKIVQPSTVSAQKHSATVKNFDIFAASIQTLGTSVRLQCAARSA